MTRLRFVYWPITSCITRSLLSYAPSQVHESEVIKADEYSDCKRPKWFPKLFLDKPRKFLNSALSYIIRTQVQAFDYPEIE